VQINEYLQGNILTEVNEFVQPANSGSTSHNQNFASILNELDSLETNSDIAQQTPSWVDPAYGYDPLNPRKPNLKEMMNIIEAEINSGVEEKNYINSSSNLIAAEILYGVVGSGEDTRDWKKIMDSENILSAARQETANLHEPRLEIISEFDANMIVIDQKAAIKNKDDDTLLVLGGAAPQVKEKLFTFGVTNDTIPDNLEEQIVIETFEQEIITGIQDFKSEILAVEIEPELNTSSYYQSVESPKPERIDDKSLLAYSAVEKSKQKVSDLFLDLDQDNS
jgi:hypothetical protein